MKSHKDMGNATRGRVPMFSVTMLSIATLASCSLLSTQDLQPGAENVRLYASDEKIENCTFVNEVIGSEGHWYNYLFISNRDLTQGAVNDLKNRAMAIEANAVHVHTNMFFTTSVTILGQAYRCRLSP